MQLFYITNSSKQIKSLQACSTWTYLKKNPEEGPRFVECSPTFKICSLNSSNNKRYEPAESEDKLQIETLYYDKNSFTNNLIKKLVFENTKLSFENVTQLNVGAKR